MAQDATMELEHEHWARGVELVCGVDEVGRGAWAGPLVVGAVVFARGATALPGVRDSKACTPRSRQRLELQLRAAVRCWGLGSVSPAEIDQVGMSRALCLGAERALAALSCTPEVVLLDGPHDFLGDPRSQAVLGGDSRSQSIAAASILAKVHRDRELEELHSRYPVYDLARNKGYGAPAHRAAIQEHGLTEIHRRSWKLPS